MRSKSRSKNRKKSTRQFINTRSITAYSLITYRGDEIAFFIIKPSNLSVLSPESLSARINALMNVLKGFTEFEMLCLDSRESFENNKQHLRRRMDEEQVPEIKALLEKDARHLDLIQVQMATAREFLLLVRMRDLKKQEIYPFLSRIEKMVQEQGFKTRRADNDDIKRILAVYWDEYTYFKKNRRNGTTGFCNKGKAIPTKAGKKIEKGRNKKQWRACQQARHCFSPT